MKKLTCFKAYDIRGKLGEELNEDIAWRIGSDKQRLMRRLHPSVAIREAHHIILFEIRAGAHFN